MPMRSFVLLLFAGLHLSIPGCSRESAPEATYGNATITSTDETDSSERDSDTADDSPPARPEVTDGVDSEDIALSRLWTLIGNPITEGDDTLELTAALPPDARVLHAWIGDAYAGRADVVSQDTGALSLDISALPAGHHRVVVAVDDASAALGAATFRRSHPFYILVTNDWDDPNNPDPTLERQERLHENHPELVMTHFVGPYTFTTPLVTSSRKKRLAEWVTGQRDTYGDEIGVHIHPYCHFVLAAGVSCRAQPSFAYAAGDLTGYSVYLSAYTEKETLTLAQKAIEIFESNGLGRPTSFRAGGWTAQLHTLRALQSAGFSADSSANNWRRLEEWADVPGAGLYQWNKENWSTIDETSQPYFPSSSDILSDEPPTLSILEVPDNGILVDYVTANEMVEMFHTNYDDFAHDFPRVYVIGYHPPNFDETFFERIDDALTHFDGYLHASDFGPVVYETVTPIAELWKFLR